MQRRGWLIAVAGGVIGLSAVFAHSVYGADRPHPAAPRPLAAQTGGLLSQPVLPLAVALQAATAAQEACVQQGYRVSVAIVGRDGQVQVHLRGDGSGPHTLASSERKAYTSASLGQPTAALDANSRNPGGQGVREIPGLLLLAGGLPIRAGDAVIAGIGVGGAPGGDLDAGCAQAGIDAIAGQLQ